MIINYLYYEQVAQFTKLHDCNGLYYEINEPSRPQHKYSKLLYF